VTGTGEKEGPTSTLSFKVSPTAVSGTSKRKTLASCLQTIGPVGIKALAARARKKVIAESLWARNLRGEIGTRTHSKSELPRFSLGVQVKQTELTVGHSSPPRPKPCGGKGFCFLIWVASGPLNRERQEKGGNASFDPANSEGLGGKLRGHKSGEASS